MQATDVMIHFNDPLSRDDEMAIEAAMREVDGIIAPRFNKPHLLMVLYDCDKLTTEALLNAAKASGHEGHLIGL